MPNFSINFALDLPDGFVAPLPYSVGLTLLGFVGAILILSLIIIMLINSVANFRKSYLSRHKPKPPVRELRAKYFALLDEILVLFKNGQLNEDGVYYETASTLRKYASERSGDDLRSMTKRDLEGKEGLTILHDSIAELYNPEFKNRTAEQDIMSPEDAVEFVKSILRRWS
ncbi:MAG: hypothetical protein LBQ41_00255 [Candidatus Ancillula sp.]|nr:hypothetical protein [Candidatus Ancillula sp.]